MLCTLLAFSCNLHTHTHTYAYMYVHKQARALTDALQLQLLFFATQLSLFMRFTAPKNWKTF